MNDNEVKKAFKEQVDLIGSMSDVYLNEDEALKLYMAMKNVLAYINQLEAKVERLTNKCNDCAGCTQWKCDCSNIKSEAIKEFANDIINNILPEFMNGKEEKALQISFAISKRAQEMVGDENV